jgi:hypothetical protein
MASSKEAVAQNGEQGSSKVKLEGEALKDAIKKQVRPMPHVSGSQM